MDTPLVLIEFPADDPGRARRFWSDLLGVELAERSEAEGRGWQTHTGDLAVGIHERGSGPGDTVSLLRISRRRASRPHLPRRLRVAPNS